MEKADHTGESATGLLIDELDMLAARGLEFGCYVIGFEADVVQAAAVSISNSSINSPVADSPV